jgi:hypothetical protein
MFLLTLGPVLHTPRSVGSNCSAKFYLFVMVTKQNPWVNVLNLVNQSKLAEVVTPLLLLEGCRPLASFQLHEKMSPHLAMGCPTLQCPLGLYLGCLSVLILKICSYHFSFCLSILSAKLNIFNTERTYVLHFLSRAVYPIQDVWTSFQLTLFSSTLISLLSSFHCISQHRQCH